MAPIRILIVAGEASGDLHGGGLVNALKETHPSWVFEGVGGDKMRKAGVTTLFDIGRMGGMGFFEFWTQIFHHLKIFRVLSKAIARQTYDAAILINYPVLNLNLAKKCKKADCPVIYFISPQVWAWRKWRIETIRQTGGKMIVILPFEEKLYREAGVDAEFLGHPFVDMARPDMTREEALKKFNLDPQFKTVGLLPGSRLSEIRLLLGAMVQAARIINKAMGRCQFLLPVADTIDPHMIRDQLGSNDLDIRIVPGENYNVMNCSDHLVVASGSATLEAGLIGCPMTIVYKIHPLTHFLGKRLVNIEHFGLINIVAGERVVPEFLNQQASPENIAREVLKVLKDPDKHASITNRLGQIRATLGAPGVMQRIAGSITGSLNLPISATDEKASV